MILHFAKENDFKVSRPAGLARSAREGGREGGRETLRTGRFTPVPPPPAVLVLPTSRWAPVGVTLTGGGWGRSVSCVTGEGSD